MKEFQSQEGGRHVYNSDFKNLQELALAMQELFRDAEGNFVISGCAVTINNNNTVSVTSGYVYIDGKIRNVAASTQNTITNLCIIPVEEEGEEIPYADGGTANQYINYYAEVSTSSSDSNAIAYDSTLKGFPNLANFWMNHYSISKIADNQQINELTVNKNFSVNGKFTAPNGVYLTDNIYVIYSSNGIEIHNGDYSYVFQNNGAIMFLKNGAPFMGCGTTSYNGNAAFHIGNANASSFSANKIILNGTNITDLLSPLGIVQMWAGVVDALPSNYMLCDGRKLYIKTYSDLYKVIGNSFNTAYDYEGNRYEDPGTNYFRLPDLRSRFIVGHDGKSNEMMCGETGGAASVVLTQQQIPSHSHNFYNAYMLLDDTTLQHFVDIYGESAFLGGNDALDGASSYTGEYVGTPQTLYYPQYYNEAGALGFIDRTIDNISNNEAHENRPPFYTLAYIMRVK